MLKADDPLAPPGAAFDEPWQAQALALADSLVSAGVITAPEWSAALGAKLEDAAKRRAPDTAETYYRAAVCALEELIDTHTPITGAERAARRRAWERAYRRTPHGKPVAL